MSKQRESLGSTASTMDVRWPREGVALVVLGGEHDLDSADRLSTVLADALDACSHLVVDVSTTTFIDTSTIRALIATKDRAEASERRFNLLMGTEPIVGRALEITNVLGVLNRVHTLEEALDGAR